MPTIPGPLGKGFVKTLKESFADNYTLLKYYSLYTIICGSHGKLCKCFWQSYAKVMFRGDTIKYYRI